MRLFRYHALYRIRRGEPIPDIKPRGDVTLKPVTVENVNDVGTFRSPEIVAIFRRQVEQGQLGVYAYRNGEAVAHGWMIINPGPTRIRANNYFVLKPREALVHFCSVAEPHRGLGIYQALLCELYRRAFDATPTEVIHIDSVIDNIPSRKAIERTAGFVSNAYYINAFSKGYRLPWT
jgi:hypothetical protein